MLDPDRAAQTTYPPMSIRFVLAVAGLPLFLGSFTGCRAELGECDEAAARQIVFRITPAGEEPEEETFAGGIEDGAPLYAGQALMQIHCGDSGFCHSPSAEGAGRAGAPFGLDFDLALACRVGVDPCCDEAQCEAYAMDACEGSAEPDCVQTTYDTEMARVGEGIERLRRNQRQTYDHRYDVLRTVQDGSMPPGAAGQGTRAFAEYYGEFEAGTFSGRIPTLETRAGREVLRNWLACGSPVLEFSIPQDDDDGPGDDCGAGPVGRCGVAAPGLEPPDPTWDSIYDRVLRPLCVSCHQPDNPFWGYNEAGNGQELDYSNSADALTAMVGIEAESRSAATDVDCAGSGTLIVAGDADASIFFRKMTADPGCGESMPLREGGRGLPDNVLDPIREWIEAGAMP
jgi:hypothetical protein